MTSSPRSAFAVGLTLVLFVAVAPSCSSGGGGTGGGTGGTGVGGGTGGAGGGTGVVSFCTDFAAAYCDFAIRCGFASAAARTECTSYVGPLYCAGAGSITKGYQSLDPAQAQTCVAAVADAGCNLSSSPLSGPACATVVTPKSSTNEGCFSSADCKNPTEGCGGANCMQTCRAAGAQGQPCPQTGNCATGLHCDSVTNTCVPPAGVGEACGYSSDCSATTYCDFSSRTCLALPTAGQTCRTSFPECTSGTYCSGTLCQAKLALGVTCTSSTACQDALFCDFSKTPDSCQTRLGQGASCAGTGYDSCQSNLRCISSVCQAPRAAGGSCTGFNDCAGGLSCDDVLRTCQAYVSDLKAGQTCTGDTRNCSGEVVCKGAVVNSSGGIGTVGTCAVANVGDSCSSRFSLECPAASFCNLAVDGGPGTCVAASLGSPCQASTRNCLPGSYCEGGLCAEQKASGASCTSNSNCKTPLQCITNPSTGAKLCGSLPDVGQACVTGSSNACLFPSICVSGTCVHAGQPGEKCLGGGSCFSGRCESDGGICQPPVGAGAACRANTECTSGRCFQGKCEALCQ